MPLPSICTNRSGASSLNRSRIPSNAPAMRFCTKLPASLNPTPTTRSTLPFHLLLRILRQDRRGLVPNLEVVHAEVGRVGVGHVDRHQRNIGLLEDVRHARRRRFLHLELQHQVHSLGHKLLGVAHRHVGIVAVVEHDQLHARCSRRRSHALRHRF